MGRQGDLRSVRLRQGGESVGGRGDAVALPYRIAFASGLDAADTVEWVTAPVTASAVRVTGVALSRRVGIRSKVPIGIREGLKMPLSR